MAKTKKTTEKNSAQTDSPKIKHLVQLPRLRRIEGQVRGLQKMIDSERNCLDITHQITATINALRRVQNDMLSEHLAALGEEIILQDMPPQTRRELADEIREHLKNLS